MGRPGGKSICRPPSLMSTAPKQGHVPRAIRVLIESNHRVIPRPSMNGKTASVLVDLKRLETVLLTVSQTGTKPTKQRRTHVHAQWRVSLLILSGLNASN